ncbi:MAG: S8 family serine peptidase, partial [Candidatus Andersenbacteria bacterium]
GIDMVIGVAATDDEGTPASFSNYGSCVNISAPGQRLYSTKTNGNYGTMTGTSMSAPLVAGVAGLYKALHPNATASEIIAAVSSGEAFTGSQATTWTNNYKSKLDAAKVMGVPTTQTPVITNPTPQASGSSGGGGGGGDSGGGGGGGGGEESQPAPKKKGAVKGIKVYISAADRKAPDFIQNATVPVVVDRLFTQVFGRKLTPIESTFWKLRARSDKATETKLKGAMAFFKVKGKTYDPKLLPALPTKKKK